MTWLTDEPKGAVAKSIDTRVGANLRTVIAPTRLVLIPNGANLGAYALWKKLEEDYTAWLDQVAPIKNEQYVNFQHDKPTVAANQADFLELVNLLKQHPQFEPTTINATMCLNFAKKLPHKYAQTKLLSAKLKWSFEELIATLEQEEMEPEPARTAHVASTVPAATSQASLATEIGNVVALQLAAALKTLQTSPAASPTTRPTPSKRPPPPGSTWLEDGTPICVKCKKPGHVSAKCQHDLNQLPRATRSNGPGS